mgnify:CR=1 FL=1
MARDPYELNQYATSTIKSSNGTTYTATLWWDSSGSDKVWTLGPSGAEINYESETVDDKNSPILTSTLSFPVMVENLTQQIWINGVRTSKQEKNVWITIRFGVTGDFLWCGYLIMDLETREDVSFPYETTLTAIDGIATLKEVPFLRELSTEASPVVPTYPYVREDTWDNGGFQRFIGNSSSWMKILLDNVGQLLESDDLDTGTPLLENYYIQTAFNWWNDDMDVSPSVDEDPLYNMRISMQPFYSQDENGYMDVPNCYDVLKDICTNFGMRLIYWNHTFHFVQVNEYNTDESGVAPYTTPINIPTREYYYTGGTRADRDYLGDTNYTLYKMVFENATNPGAGLQKLSGANTQALPAIKKTTGIYLENAGNNIFNGFPLFLTHNTGSITPTAWTTDNAYHEFLQNPNLNGLEQTMEISNAKDLEGFIFKLYCDFSNTCESAIRMQTLWTIRAKPSGSAWGDSDNMTMYKHQAATYAEFRWMSAVGEYPLSNNQQYARENIWIPGNVGVNAPVTLEVFNSTTNTTTNTTSNLIPTDNAFEDEWDFQFYTFTGFDNNATNPMDAQGETALYSHGRIVAIYDSNLATGSGTTPITVREVPTYYDYNYEDTPDLNVSPQYLSQFVPIASGSSTFGTASVETQTTQDSTDTYVYDIGELKWGDGTGANTFTTIQVWDGANWIFVNSTGKWAQGIYVWNAGTTQYDYSSLTYNKKIINLLSQNILYNQSESILTLGAQSALSETDKYYSGTSKLKFMNPLVKLNDTDGTEYILMRGTFKMNMDEWDVNMVQIKYSVPTTVVGDRIIRSAG